MSEYERPLTLLDRLGFPRRLGRTPEGWWVVAINERTGTFTWAYDRQVREA